MSTTSKRRLRLTETIRRYLMPTTEAAGDTYVPPPPDPEDGPMRFGLTMPPDNVGSAVMGPILTMGEAFALYVPDDHDARMRVWRRRHPESAEVFDGVHQLEAGVVPVNQPFTLEGEDDGH
ncbi:hypothetical protein [Dietzia natronolimnaea]|uniref:hypothetical protein n=1 Tax=Dietzia natronolimnaea TaxID=161920 RepID=UPI0015F8E099|nr:hypothetical protein [Dietzia natronolimnaea]MBB1037836.1 hypothetical protein [Dietzia natronolimnaea]